MDAQRQRTSGRVSHLTQACLAAKMDTQAVESLLLAADLRRDYLAGSAGLSQLQDRHDHRHHGNDQPSCGDEHADYTRVSALLIQGLLEEGGPKPGPSR